MNIFIGIILFICCILFGYIKADKYIKKRKYYFDFYTFNKILKSEIEFTKNTLTTIIKNHEKNDFINTFENFILYENFSFNKNYLTEEDISFLKNYLSVIGKGDRYSQIQFIDKISLQIDNNYSVAQSEEKKYKTLYVKISFLVGLMLFILFL